MLTRLPLINENPQPRVKFLENSKCPYNFGSQLLNLPYQDLEDLLLPITVLHLRQMYPHWTSQAYHGLVELHLCSVMLPAARITKSQLVTILKSSPGLRVFHFNLDLIKDSLVDAPIVPVRLDDLEVLNLISMDLDRLGIFF
jgi:hypothetical protein